MNEKLSTFDWIKHILLNLIFVISGNVIVYFYHYFDKTHSNLFTIFYALELIYGTILVSLFFYHFGIYLNDTYHQFTLKRTVTEMIYVIGIMLAGFSIGIMQIVIYQSVGFLIVFSIYLLFYGIYLNDLLGHRKEILNRYQFIHLKGTI